MPRRSKVLPGAEDADYLSAYQKKVTRRRLLVASLWLEEGIQGLENLRQALEDKYGIKVSIPTVARDIKEVRELAVEDVRAKVVETYAAMFNEAWDSWHESKGERRIVTVRERTDKEGNEYTETITRTEVVSGDPRHWANAEKVLEAMRKIYGVDAPSQYEIKFKDDFNKLLDYMQQNLPDQEFKKVLMVLSGYEGI